MALNWWVYIVDRGGRLYVGITTDLDNRMRQHGRQRPAFQKRAFSFPNMAFFVCILCSETTGRHYCGSTSDVERRLRLHNDPEYWLTKTTMRFQGPCNSHTSVLWLSDMLSPLADKWRHFFWS